MGSKHWFTSIVALCVPLLSVSEFRVWGFGAPGLGDFGG